MNKKANFWYWVGIILICLYGLFLYFNIDKFENITENADFLLVSLMVALIIGLLVFYMCYFKGQMNHNTLKSLTKTFQ